MKTEQERINQLEKTIRGFKIAVSGDGDVLGGFGELPKKGVTLEHIETAFEKFSLVGQNGVRAHGSIKDGYVLTGASK